MIRAKTENRIAFVELARLDKKNALTGEMYRQLADAISAADKDAQVRSTCVTSPRSSSLSCWSNRR